MQTQFMGEKGEGALNAFKMKGLLACLDKTLAPGTDDKDPLEDYPLQKPPVCVGAVCGGPVASAPGN